MQAVILQLDLAWHDREANHQAARELLRRDPPEAGDLVVLPEAFPVGFSMQIDAIADRTGATDAFVSEIAKEYGVTMVAGNITKPDDRGRNVAIVCAPDGHILARYEKLHPFSFAGEHEKYKPGDKLAYFQWNGAMASPFICYDLRFPEVFRMAAHGGTEVFVVIANWPTPRVRHWISLLVARAIENQAYVLACNRTGADPHVPYPGRSVVIDPKGDIIADAGDKPGVLKSPIDIESLRAYRKAFPALRDMRFVGEGCAISTPRGND